MEVGHSVDSEFEFGLGYSLIASCSMVDPVPHSS
jgi:hypothetical protein